MDDLYYADDLYVDDFFFAESGARSKSKGMMSKAKGSKGGGHRMKMMMMMMTRSRDFFTDSRGKSNWKHLHSLMLL